MGYAVLSMDQVSWLYLSTVLLILGHAVFKPNIIAAIGQLYSPKDLRRAEAYSIFHVVLSVGAAIVLLAGGSS